jgi:hypothetical protein
MNVSAEEIKAAVKDPTSPLSAGEELPEGSQGNGAPPRGDAPAESA